MREKELIHDIARQARVSKVDAKRVLRALSTSVSKALMEGESVPLIGLGTFSVSERKARLGRNPQTGKEIKISARKAARFKAGAKLRKHVK